MNQIFQIINNLKIPLSIKKLRKIFIILIIAFFIGAVSESLSDGGIIWKEARNESGELAWYLLLFTIFISLFSKIFSKTKILRQLLPLRKEAGILVFIIVCFHAIFHFIRAGVLGDFAGMYAEAITRDWAILLGSIAFLIMIPLIITSTTKAIQKMGAKSWKFLHKTTHIVFILAALHMSFIHFSGRGEIDFNPLAMLAVYIIGYVYLFLRNKKTS